MNTCISLRFKVENNNKKRTQNLVNILNVHVISLDLIFSHLVKDNFVKIIEG